MGTFSRQLNRGECLLPTAVELLGEPLEFIHEDHLRERQICAMIDDIAAGEAPNGASVTDAHAFLTNELPLHLKDEEEDLFPLLRRRCEPDDEIDKVIAKLTADHVHAGEDTPQVVRVLEDLANEARAPQEDERAVLRAFAAHSRRHLILENAIILPFARLRLTVLDLETLYIRMCQRRGLESLRRNAPEKGPDA